MLVAVSSLLLGLACVYMGFVRNAVMLGLGFFLLRLLGQGSLSLVSKNAINQWWVRRRGMAMGISGLAGAALGMGCFPTLCNWLIGVGGWRGGSARGCWSRACGRLETALGWDEETVLPTLGHTAEPGENQTEAVRGVGVHAVFIVRTAR